MKPLKTITVLTCTNSIEKCVKFFLCPKIMINCLYPVYRLLLCWVSQDHDEAPKVVCCGGTLNENHQEREGAEHHFQKVPVMS